MSFYRMVKLRRMKNLVNLTLITIWLMLSSRGITAQDDRRLSWQGSFKSRLFAIHSPFELDKHQAHSKVWSSSARLKVLYQQSDQISWEAAYDLSLRYRSQIEVLPADLSTSTFKYRIFDLNQKVAAHRFGDESDLYSYHNLDRVIAIWSKDTFDLLVGRQPISFGSARLVNPTDVFLPYAITAVDQEEREGVDAIRLQLPIGAMGELDIGVVIGEHGKADNSAAFLRLLYPVAGQDIALMFVNFRQNTLWGIDVQGALSGAGIWLESAYVKPNHGASYLRYSLGSDYSFSDNWYGFIEYYHNGAGSLSHKNYLSRSTMSAYQEGGVFLLGREYLSLGASYQLSALLTLSQHITANLNDRSLLLSPKIEWNFLEDHYLEAGIFYGLGSSSNSYLEINSEFGAYSKTIYLGYRTYL